MKKSLFGKSIFIAIMETFAASSFIVMAVFVSAFILNLIFTINYNKQGINDVSVNSSRSLGENTALTSFANKIPLVQSVKDFFMSKI